jgi:hypothetical protein
MYRPRQRAIDGFRVTPAEVAENVFASGKPLNVGEETKT